MPVLRDFKIKIERDEVLKQQTGRTPTRELLDNADWAVQRALELAEPAIAYATYRSEGV